MLPRTLRREIIGVLFLCRTDTSSCLETIAKKASTLVIGACLRDGGSKAELSLHTIRTTRTHSDLFQLYVRLDGVALVGVLTDCRWVFIPTCWQLAFRARCALTCGLVAVRTQHRYPDRVFLESQPIHLVTITFGRTPVFFRA